MITPERGPQAVDVLVLNSGSSSLKFGVLRVDHAGIAPLLLQTLPPLAAPAAFARVNAALAAASLCTPHAIGHRFVHGGALLRHPCRVDTAVLQQLHAAVPFAPLHMPQALALLAEAQRAFPAVPQVVCFDTTFHAGLPDVAQTLPLPQVFQGSGIRRYGFHGISCESIVAQLIPLPRRLIIAHLGQGASVTAVHAGHSRDTTMGMTPTGGVIMGTRSGDLDPGVLLYLLRTHTRDPAVLETLLNQQSGLLGISGISGDLRELRRLEATDDAARLAVDMFCYAVSKQIAAMIAVLEGLDCLVFTGGIGEHDAVTRARICARLAWFGIGLDADRNHAATNPVSTHDSRATIRVMAAQEAVRIADLTARVVRAT